MRVGSAVAEPAIAVADDWQRRGVGSRLLDELADRAREEGIREFAASVLADNSAAIAVLSQLGRTHVVDHGHELKMLIALEEERGAVATLHRLLRHAAEQTIRPQRRIADDCRRGTKPSVVLSMPFDFPFLSLFVLFLAKFAQPCQFFRFCFVVFFF